MKNQCITLLMAVGLATGMSARAESDNEPKAGISAQAVATTVGQAALATIVAIKAVPYIKNNPVSCCIGALVTGFSAAILGLAYNHDSRKHANPNRDAAVHSLLLGAGVLFVLKFCSAITFGA